MPPPGSRRWQQATALVSLSAGGAMTGFSFAHGTAAEMTSPTRMPVNLMALEQAGQAGQAAQASDGALRAAIVNVAKYYLRMAQTKTPGRDGGAHLAAATAWTARTTASPAPRSPA